MQRILLLVAFLAAACKSTPAWLNLPGPVHQQGVEVVVDGAKTVSMMVSSINGEAINRTGGDLVRCTISFEAYDLHGAHLATARAERDEWLAGESWSFQADFPRYVDDVRTVSAARVLVVR
jgi:hypothetical protein